MTIKNQLQSAVSDIFVTFSDFVEDVTYIQKTSEYKAGGSNIVNKRQFTLKAINLGSERSIELEDIPVSAKEYIFITSELPVNPDVKDNVITTNGVESSIVAFSQVPGEIVTFMYLGDSSLTRN